jgi:rhamnosyltransferase
MASGKDARSTRRWPKPEASNICTIVVTFNPDVTLHTRLESLTKGVARLVVVDNGSDAKSRDTLELIAREPKAQVIYNNENLGLAHALNQGLALAHKAGLPWLLTLDQDTTPLQNMVDTLTAAYDACPFRQEVAVVGSRFGAALEQPISQGAAFTEETVVITAGSLLDVDAALAVGGFREDFFIDFVDIELCLRLRRAGLRVIRSSAPTIQHEVGQPRSHRLLSREVTATHHNALRRYYMTRNRIIVWREYLGRERSFVLHDMKRFAKELVKLVFFEEGRTRKLLQLVRGLADGLTGRTRARGGFRRV